MKYVVARIGNRQFRLGEGQQVAVDRVDGKVSEVLLFVDNGNVQIGRPLVSGVRVKTKVLEEGKDKKIIVRRFKAKSRYRKTKGHRQPITKLLVEKIEVT